MLRAQPVFWLALAAALGLAAFSIHLDQRDAPLGVTECIEGMPVVWIRPDLTPGEKALVARHEARHVEQAHALGCERFSELVETPEGWLQLEAEAYCADIREMMTTEQGVREGADALIERFLTGRRYRHLQRLGREQVERVIYEACEREPGDIPV
jgi:hypothetical protein